MAQKARKERERQELAKTIVATYDKDNSGSLSWSEVKTMLMAFSLEHHKMQPSEEDAQYLLMLCDKGGKDGGNDAIDSSEVLHVVNAWKEFLDQYSTVKDLIDTHDEDQNTQVDEEELKAVLSEVAADIIELPDQVVSWIFKTSDISGNGFLNMIELARALCALEMWMTDSTPTSPVKYNKGMNKGIVVQKDLPAAQKKSSTCTLL